MMNMNDTQNLKMNLQLFAEPAPDGAEPTQPDAGAQEPPQEPEQKPRTFTQEELEAAITSRLNRYKRDEAKRIDAARNEGRSEAEKLAKMTEDQRIEHERQRAEQEARDRETALATREAEITRRELRAAAIDTLAQKGLPRGLEAILNYADADVCNASLRLFLLEAHSKRGTYTRRSVRCVRSPQVV